MAYADVEDGLGLYGVGGWMYLFLFGFAILSPLMLIGSTYISLYTDPEIAAMFADNWLAYQIYSWILVASAVALIAFVVWRLFYRQNPMTIKITVIAIPLLSIGLVHLDIISLSLFLDVTYSELMVEYPAEFIRSVFYCMIWCPYFLVSKRVKNTYMMGEEHSEVEGVFD